MGRINSDNVIHQYTQDVKDLQELVAPAQGQASETKNHRPLDVNIHRIEPLEDMEALSLGESTTLPSISLNLKPYTPPGYEREVLKAAIRAIRNELKDELAVAVQSAREEGVQSGRLQGGTYGGIGGLVVGALITSIAAWRIFRNRTASTKGTE